MGNIVIDANIFKAFYEVEILGYTPPRPERTGDANPIFDSLGSSAIAIMDSEGQIEVEWRNMCQGGEEWFSAWLADAYDNLHAIMIEVPSQPLLRKQLSQLGFPVSSRDFWYIRICIALQELCNKHDIHLITEDIEFYSPENKHSHKKNRFIQQSKGVVAKYLQDKSIYPCCISNYLAISQSNP